MSSRLKSAIAHLGMEIPLCLYMTTSYLKSPVFQNLIYEKACLERYDQDLNMCQNVSAYYSDTKVQGDANHFYFLSSIVLTLPSIFAGLILGAASDVWSIKIPLLIPFVGLIVGTINYIVQTYYMLWSLNWLLLSDAVFGLCGGYISIISTTLSYGVKTSSVGRRSIRIAGMEGAIGLGGTIGYAASGTIREALGYSYTFLLILVIQVIAFLYIIIFAKEKERTQEDSDQPVLIARVGKRIGNAMLEFYSMLAMQRPTKILIILNLLSLGVELFIFAGLSDIQYSYFRYKLGWADKQYGWFSGVSFGITTAAVLILYPLLHMRWPRDGLLGCLGIITKIISLVMLAFLTNAAMAYSIAVVTMLNRFVSTGFRAFLSSLIDTKEQGKMFSVISLLEGVTSLLATTAYNNAFPATLSFFPGLCYLISAILLLPPLFILGFSDIRLSRMNRGSHSLSETTEPREANIEEAIADTIENANEQ